MSNVVHLDIAEDRATVTLDNPGVRNAITEDVARGIMDAFETIADSDARCVLVQSSEGAFSAGGDIDAMVEGVAGDIAPAEVTERIVDETAGAVAAVRNCRVPTVAKLDGPAFGAGAALAIACDVLLASEDAGISFGFRQVGLAVDSGVSYMLPRLVGENTAKELVYTGELIDAGRAAEIGIFNRVCSEAELDGQVEAFLDRVETGPTVALSASKRLLQQGLSSSFQQAVENEAAAQATAFTTADHEEGATAFIEEREPDFRGE